MQSGIRLAMGVAAVVFGLGGLASAQSNRGTLSGTVTDSSGAVIASATVTVTNSGTNVTVKLATSAQGTYSLPNLEPVYYDVKVEAPGFRPKLASKVKVDTASVTTLDLTLDLARVEQTVEVTTEAPLISADSAVQSTTLTTEMIRDLPIPQRNVLELALTLPNVGGEVGSEDPEYTGATPSPGVAINFNGSRPGESVILADGVNNTGVSLARQVVSFSPDTVQEVTVQTSSFSAEYGRTGGGIINTTTKSGTNRLNGLASWYVRNPAFNAKDYNPRGTINARDALHENTGTFTLGGPVMLPYVWTGGPGLYDGRNRTFFFASFEPRWRSDGELDYALLPDQGMLRGDFSNVVNVPGGYVRQDVADRLGLRPTGTFQLYRQFDLDASGKQLSRITLAPGQTFPAFPNNVIPREYLDPVSQKLLAFLPPAGDYFILNGQVRNYVGDRHVMVRERRHSVKVDHVISASNRFSVRSTSVPIFGERGIGPATEDLVVNSRVARYSASRQLLISDTHVFSPALINTINLNYTRGRWDNSVPKTWQTRNLSTELGLPSGTSWGIPRFNVGIPGFSIGINDSINHARLGIITNSEQSYNINNVLSKIHGTMTWKFGADLNQQTMANSHIGTFQGGIYGFSAAHTNSATSSGTGGDTFASFLLGIPNSVDLRTAIVPYKYVWRAMDLFTQNDWKVKRNVTLSLGLRYSLNFPRVERSNLQGVFDFSRKLEVDVPQQPIRSSATGNPVVTNFPQELLPKKTLVPVFAFAGRGGRGRTIMPLDKNNFAPRLGVAWTPRLWGMNRRARTIVVRANYGMSYTPLTGDDRRPLPDLGGQVSGGFGAFSGAVNPTYVMRMCCNGPDYRTVNPLLSLPADGLISTDSLALAVADSFAVSPLFRTPYTHMWNVAIEIGLARETSLRVQYDGSYGHFFFPPMNYNVGPVRYTDALVAANLDPNLTVLDPLGRKDTASRTLTVRLGTLASPFLGFTNINERYRADARNFRNAASLFLRRRTAAGLSGTVAYTFGKTLNDAADAGTDNAGYARTHGQVSYSGNPRAEYAVAEYDITHTLSSTFLYELPLGTNRRFFRGVPAWGEAIVGGWNLGGILTARTGHPVRAYLQDTNGFPTSSGRLRADRNASEPIKNPLWERGCPFGEGCEPYLNPAAFLRPAKGHVGNSPRTISQARFPGSAVLNLTVQKDFFLFGRESRRKLQFRAEAINALNHVNLMYDGNNSMNWSNSYPLETDISVTEFNNWARANPQWNIPLMPTASGAAPTPEYAQVLNITRAARKGASSGPLPADFFAVPVPRGFTTTDANTFDLRTEQGLKLYRLKNAFDTAEWGIIQRAGRMRVVTFSLRLYF